MSTATLTRHRVVYVVGSLAKGSINRQLARGLVAAGKTVEAIAILEMNAEFNPRSVTIAFELGELYRQRGDKDKAIASYQRALQINPDNPAARQRLAELGVRPPGM